MLFQELSSRSLTAKITTLALKSGTAVGLWINVEAVDSGIYLTI